MAFNTSEMKSEPMRISLEDILPSLARHLYGDDWRIAIRELLQNCHDAIVEGEAFKAMPESPRIDVYPNHREGTLTFKDNGVGMTKDEVREHLATVGSGSKAAEIRKLIDDGKADRDALDKIIGQYGIGFLASFIIAKQVQVVTRSGKGKAASGVRAVFTGKTDWHHGDAAEAEHGTAVTLLLKDEPVTDPTTGKEFKINDFLNFETLRAEIKRFGDLLPYPIYVHRSAEDIDGILCNAMKGPWEEDVPDHDKLEEFYLERHPDENTPIHIIPFKLEPAGYKIAAHGMIYFPRKGKGAALSEFSSSSVELWCRRMFITQAIPSLLPSWAPFVGLLVECPDLSPTLSRNDIIQHDPNFVALKQGLAKQITTQLKNLAERENKTFRAIVYQHREQFYSSLLTDYGDSPEGHEDFFRSIIDHIPFTVISRSEPVGRQMTLRMYRDQYSKKQKSESKQDSVYYLDNQLDMGQFKAMIIQRDIPVVLALHQLESHLLRAYGRAFGEDVSMTDVRDILDVYVNPVDKAEYELMIQFLVNLEGNESPDDVQPARLEPSYVPAILFVQSAVDPKRAQILQDILNQGGQVLQGRVRKVMEEEIRASATGKSVVTLILNDNNPVVRHIREYTEKNGQLSTTCVDVLHEIYHSARAFRESAFAETAHCFEHRNNLLLALMQQGNQLSRLQSERDSLALTVKEKRQQKAPDVMEAVDCALLLTDLRGSTRMVGFLDQPDCAEILQQYALKVKTIVEKLGGRVEKFTGDGIFGYFGLELAHSQIAVQSAYDCAFEVRGLTQKFFARGEVAKTCLSANIQIQGCRTVLHFGKVMHGQVAGMSALVGRNVVALFRACDRNELFDQCPIIMSEPFMIALNQPQRPAPVAKEIRLDDSLPPMTFYPHLAFVPQGSRD